MLYVLSIRDAQRQQHAVSGIDPVINIATIKITVIIIVKISVILTLLRVC